MPLIDEAYVRQVGNLPDKVETATVTPHLSAAALRLKRWVGATAYSDAGAASPSDPDRAAALKLAEARLALAEMFASLAGNYQGMGFVGGASHTEGQSSYLTPAQVETLAVQHLAAAERLAQPYLKSPAALAGVVKDLDGDA
ncbi:MAG: hypothetical protein K9K34_19410 [Desulfarculaceae bacterium]|nr:hypothetical protein [Desulfarculaceae bacterium]